ncbi:MAG: DUF4252 domain-containing protein [[Clostridium] fimetarium]|nr:DUF4252 domain-containing protein [Alistipes timonensis]MCM1406280.1 DUF4252 domain-containing protein [[Clostridium] fimetarium]
MKRFILSALLAATLFFSSCGQLKVFKGAENIPGVETTYIGGTLLRMGLNSAGADYAEIGADFGADVSTLTGLEVIETENAAAAAKLRPIIDRVVKEGNYEVGVQNKDDDEISTIYFSAPDAKNRSNMLIVNQEKNELDVVLLQGITLNGKGKKSSHRHGQ